jgi:hypothetical protein
MAFSSLKKREGTMSDGNKKRMVVTALMAVDIVINKDCEDVDLESEFTDDMKIDILKSKELAMVKAAFLTSAPMIKQAFPDAKVLITPIYGLVPLTEI